MFAIFGDKGRESIQCFCNYVKSTYKQTLFSSMPSKFPIHFSWLLGMALLFGHPCAFWKNDLRLFLSQGCCGFLFSIPGLLAFQWDIKRTTFMVKLSISLKKFSFRTWNTILLHGQKSSPLTLYHTEKWSLFSYSICFFPDFILIFIIFSFEPKLKCFHKGKHTGRD